MNHITPHPLPTAANASAPTHLDLAPANPSAPTGSAPASAKASAPTHLPAMSAEEILAALFCLADKAESRAVTAMLTPPPGARPEQTFSDLRLDIAGDITETLNEIASGLGLRLMRSLYPEVDFDSIELEERDLQLFDELVDDAPPPLPQLFDELNYGVVR
jgi:hypothetical protein